MCRRARERRSSSPADDEDAPPLLLLPWQHGEFGDVDGRCSGLGRSLSHLRCGHDWRRRPERAIAPAAGIDAHALWLDDVIQAISLTRVSIAGVSLGGWLALDYAIRRPGRVESLVLVCPGGVGRVKVEVLLKLIPLQMLGSWGKRKAAEIILGRAPTNPPPEVQPFLQFIQLIQENFRPRRVKLPVFGDDALRALNMPVLAILGGKDVLIDSDDTKRRLERNVPGVQIRYIPAAGHFIPPQTTPILDFLCKSADRVTK